MIADACVITDLANPAGEWYEWSVTLVIYKNSNGGVYE
jgi:hypothetical protein